MLKNIHGNVLLGFSFTVGLVAWIISLVTHNDPRVVIIPKWLYLAVMYLGPLYLIYAVLSSILVALFANNNWGALRVHTAFTVFLCVVYGGAALFFWELREMSFWVGLALIPWLFILRIWRWNLTVS